MQSLLGIDNSYIDKGHNIYFIRQYQSNGQSVLI